MAFQIHTVLEPGQPQQVDVFGIDAQIQEPVPADGAAEPGLAGQSLDPEIVQMEELSVIGIIPVHFVHQELVHGTVPAVDMAGEGGIGQRPFDGKGVGQVAGYRPGGLEDLTERLQPDAPGL